MAFAIQFGAILGAGGVTLALNRKKRKRRRAVTAAPLIMPAQLQQLAPKADIAALTPALNAAMLAHAIVTPLRVVHFIAQGALKAPRLRRSKRISITPSRHLQMLAVAIS